MEFEITITKDEKKIMNELMKINDQRRKFAKFREGVRLSRMYAFNHSTEKKIEKWIRKIAEIDMILWDLRVGFN